MKRDAGLDLIRITSIWIIVTFHFCAVLGLSGSPFYGHANGGWGSVGTTMFFILSGYVLRLGHRDIPCPADFYRRRFLSIYPMLWIAFAAAYVIHSIDVSSFRYGGAPWKIICSLAGVDNYLGFYQVQTYAVVGEWFTAVIVVIYLLYPLLNTLFEKWTWRTTAVLAVMYFGNILFDPFVVSPDANVITGIMMFWIGMLLERYGKRIRESGIILLICAVLSVVICFVRLPLFSLPWKNLLGICIFISLLILSRNIGAYRITGTILMRFSEITYAVYLIHHFILNTLTVRCAPALISAKRILFYYGAIWCVILVFSALLYCAAKYLLILLKG